MQIPILKDPDQYPTEEIIFSSIGKCKPLWDSLFGYIHSQHPGFAEEWRYYNDGKTWLFKLTYKSRTIFWLSIIKNGFRTTFYFPAKAEELISTSNISDELKQEFIDQRENKIRGITIVYKNKKDVEFAKDLISLKLTIK
jgi:hypothetical protein